MKKNILVVAKNNKVEALRVAVGLALLDDIVKVVVLGQLDETPAILEQKEVLEFADVPCELVPDTADQTGRLAQEMVGANVVYII
ncbi:MAG: hypothetical protein D4R84_06710 [Rhodocyclaceae bacterium]|nr:MAG: hypothetical protein D4R84_06710 [Rhodocyclaceae bacterium]